MPPNAIASCPEQLPAPVARAVREFASAWASSTVRPRVHSVVRRNWLALLHAWVGDARLPLFIRRPKAGRGSVLAHESGRSLVPTDNTPANWALSLALSGKCPTLGEVRAALDADQLPVAMALHKKEKRKARFRCTRAKGAKLNRLGWKVAHIQDVGLGQLKLESAPIERLVEHFLCFLSPTNMFVVPLKWAGIAELPEVIEAVRRADEKPAKHGVAGGHQGPRTDRLR